MQAEESTSPFQDSTLARGIFIIVPAFNEEGVIREVVARLLPLGAPVVVVDDGSEDRTFAILDELPVVVLRHAINLGQGAAIQTGVEHALERGARYLVTFDADGQHDVRDIPRLLRVLMEEQADVVLASRFLGAAENLGRARRWILKLAVVFTRIVTGLPLTDAHNGLRAWRADVAGRLRLHQNRMAHASEFLHHIAREKLRYREIPCTLRYTEYSKRKGQSALGALDILYDLFIKRILR